MTWDNRYRRLNEGEIIREGDECLTDSHLGWQPAKHDIGGHAPDPNYTAHRMYRRALGPAMTSHHDVAVRLRERANCWPAEKYSGPHKALDIEAAKLLESQAKALSEAEAERTADNTRLKIQRDNALLDMEAFMNKAEAAEARLAEFKTEATKVIDELAADLRAEIEGRYAGIKHYPSEARRYARDIAPVVAARAFTNAAKETKENDNG